MKDDRGSGQGRSRGRSNRQLRVGELLRRALTEILERGELRDPDIADVSVTVTEVRVSPDLRGATAFVVPLGGGDIEKLLGGLRRAAPFLRRAVAGRVDLKYQPALSFEADVSFDHASRIDRLLDDSRRPEPGEEPDDGA